jgi:hypothetical protein
MQIVCTTFGGATNLVGRHDGADERKLVNQLMADSSLKEILLVSRMDQDAILHLIRQDTKHEWQPLRGKIG